jgi:hypothetical protein
MVIEPFFGAELIHSCAEVFWVNLATISQTEKNKD